MATYQLTRGDGYTFTETIQPVQNGVQVLPSGGVTGWSFWLTAKLNKEDDDTQAIFQKKGADWQIQTAGNTTTPAQVICTINPADTAGLPAYQVSLFYDVQAKDASNVPHTLESGIMVVSADVTISTI